MYKLIVKTEVKNNKIDYTFIFKGLYELYEHIDKYIGMGIVKAFEVIKL